MLVRGVVLPVYCKIPQKSCLVILREFVAYSEQLPQDCKIANFPRGMVWQSCGNWLLTVSNSRKIARLQDSPEVWFCNLAGVGSLQWATPAGLQDCKIHQQSGLVILRELGAYSEQLPQDCKIANFPRSLVGQSSGSWGLTMSVSRIIARRELHFRRNRFPTHTSQGVIWREYSPRKHPKA